MRSTIIDVIVRVVRHPNGPRLYVLGRRVHHFYLGLAGTAAALAARRPAFAVAAAAYALSDVRDFPWRDCDNH